MQQLLTPDAAAKLLGLAKQTVYQLVCAKKIPHVKLGRALRFNPDDLSDWVRAKSNLTGDFTGRDNHVTFDPKNGSSTND